MDTSTLSQEQIDKFLALVDGEYYCKAFKAGWYHMSTNSLIFTTDANIQKYMSIRRLSVSGDVLNAAYYNILANINGIYAPSITATMWMNAGDTLRASIDLSSVSNSPYIYPHEGTTSTFLYLGNDAKDY